MRYRVLGPVELAGTGDPPAGRLADLLSFLLLRANTWVDADAVVDALWPDGPPEAATSSVDAFVQQLRGVIGSTGADSVLQERSGAYRLAVARDELDTWRFEDLIAEARDSDGVAAVASLRAALGLWRGTPFDRLESADADVVRALFGEVRSSARLQLADVLCELDELDEAVAELRVLVAEDPRRELFWCRLVDTLHAAGLRSDALRAFQQARDALGREPGVHLHAARQRVLDDGAEQPVADGIRLLPSRLDGFVGRAEELHELTDVARQHAAADGVLVVQLDGMPGVGKSALALEAAYHLAPLFPDLQLHVDLRTHQHGVRTGEQALDAVLDTLGGGPMSADVGARAAQWRARVAGLRSIVVLDDLDDVDQLRLLTPSGHSLVLVTARQRLDLGPPARRLTVKPMTGADALTLLTADVALTDEDVEPANEAADRCGQLPAALCALNQRVRQRGWSFYRLNYRLRTAGAIREELRVGDVDVCAAFDATYRRLSDGAAGLFALLGSFPGVDFDRPAVTALAQVTAAEAGQQLGELVRHHLLDEAAGGRFVLRAAPRAYAVTVAAESDGKRRHRTAVARLVEYYDATAKHALGLLAGADTGTAEPGRPHTRQLAAAWLATERANLLATGAATGHEQLLALARAFDPADAAQHTGDADDTGDADGWQSARDGYGHLLRAWTRQRALDARAALRDRVDHERRLPA